MAGRCGGQGEENQAVTNCYAGRKGNIEGYQPYKGCFLLYISLKVNRVLASMNSQGMQQQLLEAKAAQGDLPAFLLDNKKEKENKGKKDVTLVAEWPPKTKKSKSKEPEVSTCAPPPPSSANGNVETKSAEVQTETSTPEPSTITVVDEGMPGKDARSIAILSTFLSVLSYGISTDAIASHLVNMQEGIEKDKVEQLLSRCFHHVLVLSNTFPTSGTPSVL